jgi:hypothetical protein
MSFTLRGYFGFLWRTTVHKFQVGGPMLKFAMVLIWRALIHDLSKYRWREAKWFATTNEKMKVTKPNTPEYDELRRMIDQGISAHYEANSHHPEHYKDGINGMSFVDEIEMLFDWNAASKRNVSGDPLMFIHESRGRFKHSEDRANFYVKAIKWMMKE